MAILVRNLLICFILSLCTIFIAMIWYKEIRPSSLDYSKVVELLNNDRIVALKFTGNRVTVTDQSDRLFVTVVPDVSNH